MALIVCSECKKEYSEQELVCIHCGHAKTIEGVQYDVAVWHQDIEKKSDTGGWNEPPKSDCNREVSWQLGVGIFVLPIIFSWFTLRKGYSPIAKVMAFGWMFLLYFLSENGNFATPSATRPAACDYLSSIGMPTREWKEDFQGYFCASNYYETDIINDYTLSNNIAYYVEGKQSNDWDKIKIVANVNEPKQIVETKKKIVQAINTFTLKFAGSTIINNEKEFYTDAHSGVYQQPFKAADNEYNVFFMSFSVVDWNTDKGGYEYRFELVKKPK